MYDAFSEKGWRHFQRKVPGTLGERFAVHTEKVTVTCTTSTLEEYRMLCGNAY
jgi:hypothetical protein